MRAILMSIKPKWCELIASGKKTVEVRKTAPKDTPFKVYIYQTKESKRRFLDHRFNSFFAGTSHYKDMGKVIGEFICDRVDEYLYGFANGKYIVTASELEQTRLGQEDLFLYGKGCDLAGINITDLKIYDTPKELSEFYTLGNCEKYDFCNQCKNFHRGQGWLDGSYYDEDSCLDNTRIPVTRPPQSWQYVENNDD